MTDVIQTYTRLTAPPSIALAMMAAQLAVERTYGGTRDVSYMNASFEKSTFMPTPRRYCVGRAGREYYRIIDNITWSSHPDWNTPNWCNTCSPAGIGYCRCEIACNE